MYESLLLGNQGRLARFIHWLPESLVALFYEEG